MKKKASPHRANKSSDSTSSDRSPSDSMVTMTEIVLPQHTNALSTVFGGVVVSWVDIAAATCALRHCNQQVVTASIDAVHFMKPIKLGWIVTLRAVMTYVARTSCEVEVLVTAENPITRETNHTVTAYATMVAVDHQGTPIEVPGLIVRTAEEKHRHQAGEARRKARLELKQKLKTLRQSARD